MKRLLFITSAVLIATLQANATVCKNVHFFDPDSKELKAEFQVSVAETHKQRAKGLMFVKSMPEDVGMLFSWQYPAYRAMWMKNTYIPLDMVFVENDTVVYIKKEAVPHSIQAISVEHPVDKILEINGKQAEKHNLKVGDKMLCQP